MPVPQGDALWVPDTVPHALAVVDGDIVVETVTLTDSLLKLVTDEVTDVDNVDDAVED